MRKWYQYWSLVKAYVTFLRTVSYLIDITFNYNRRYSYIFSRVFQHSMRPIAFLVVEYIVGAVSFTAMKPNHTSFLEKLDI